MSFSTQNELDRNAGAIDAEETLRLIASLPAPEGIEGRVKAGVRGSPGQAKVMSWPSASAGNGRSTQLSVMRAAAAAAIVFVVAGGGWEVYSHIQQAPVPTAVAAPQRIDGGGGLSTTGARRTPKTLDGPVVPSPANVKQRAGSGIADPVPHDLVRHTRSAATKSQSAAQR